MPKQAVRILKKKMTPKNILYKIEWSNGCISYEPFTEIGSDLLPLIQAFELNPNSNSAETKKSNGDEKERASKQEKGKDKEKENQNEKEKEKEKEKQKEKEKFKETEK